MGPVIGLSGAVGCQRSGGPENHPGERDHLASEAESGPLIGLNGAVSVRRGPLWSAIVSRYGRYSLLSAVESKQTL